VLKYYAQLWNIKPYAKDDLNSAWGYVLSMGSSEGNVYGLLNARDYLSGRYLMHPNSVLRDGSAAAATGQTFMAQATHDNPNHYKPVIFFSEDTHYSVSKAAHTLAIPSFGVVGNQQYGDKNPLAKGEPWPLEVPSTGGADGPGTINVEALATLVEFFAKNGHPILLVLNIGTTFKGAHDDVTTIVERLRPIFKEHGLDERVVVSGDDGDDASGDGSRRDVRHGYWIHIDGALGATYLPFLREANDLHGIDAKPTLPCFDFSLPEVSSIVTSGHKYPGCPWPSGIYMTRQHLQLQPPPTPDVIGSPDTTFGGSRNAFSAIVLWDFVARHSDEVQVKLIVECERRAGETMTKLRAVDEQLQKDGKDGLMLARTENSLSIRFRMPNHDIVRRYSLAHVPIAHNGGVIDYSHLYVMPHVTDDLVDRLVKELMDKDAFGQHAKSTPKAYALDVAVADRRDAVVHLAMNNRGFA
jgi:histidine decarboxylase